MIVVGLTGGIGAGKSTVAALLAERGAIIVDADAIVRELQEPGQPVFDAILQRFGEIVTTPQGGLDRAVLAALVFEDPGALEDLNAIVHPAVHQEIGRRTAEALAAGAEVVVLDIPLIAETTGRDGMDHVITVEADPEVRIARLVAHRGMRESDARGRIAAQANRAQREAIADIVIDNDGGLDALRTNVDAAWSRLT